MKNTRRMTDREYDRLKEQAEGRLSDLGLPESLMEDGSGQSTEIEHWTWLASADADKITAWAEEMNR